MVAPFRKFYGKIWVGFSLKDTLKAFDYFKNKQKRVWSNVFWYVKASVFWKCIQCTIHWDKTQMIKKDGTKNALFFLLRTPTHHSFSLNLRFLCELKHKICLSKTVCGIFHFRIRFVFILKFIFLFNKMHAFFDFKTSHNSFQN